MKTRIELEMDEAREELIVTEEEKDVLLRLLLDDEGT
jgi:hypothetical protein